MTCLATMEDEAVFENIFFPVLFGVAVEEKIIHFKDIRENDLQMEEVFVIYICFGLTKIQSRL